MTKIHVDDVLDNSENENNEGAATQPPSDETKASVSPENTETAEAEVVEPDIVEEAEAIVSESEAVATAQKEAAEWKDKYIRLHAEWDTYRRRTNEQRAEDKKRAAEKLVESLIPVIDDFERTIDYANQNGEVGLLGGVEAVHSKLINVLEKDGVEVISPAGQPYNALEAQAVQVVENPDVYDETVEQVFQKGYRLGTKVLRPAMVTVSTGGPKRPAEDSDE